MSAAKVIKTVAKEPKVFLQYDTIKLDPEHFPEPVFDKKQSKPKIDPETGELGEQINYFSAPLKYKKEDSRGRLVTEEYFDVEGPIMVSKGGIVVKKDGARYRASIWCSHPIKDETMLKYCGMPMEPSEFDKMPEVSTDDTPGKDSVGFLTQFHLRCLLAAFKVRKAIGVDARKIEGFESLFTSLLRWSTNDDGSLVENRDPNIYYNILLVGDPTKKGHKKAPFSMACDVTEQNPKGEVVVPWEYLQESLVTFKPVIRFKSIYAGGKKCSIQMEIISAVLYDFEPIVVASEQVITLAEVRQDTERVTRLADQLRKAEELLGKDCGLKLTNAVKKDKEGKEVKDGEEKEVAKKGKSKAKAKDDDADGTEDEAATTKGKLKTSTLKKTPASSVKGKLKPPAETPDGGDGTQGSLD